MSMTRKEFLGTLIGAAGAAAVLGACGGDDGGGVDGAVGRSCAMNGTSVTIGNNHGHVLVVSASDVSTGAAKTYDITGTSDHAHMVTVSAANFATLQSNANGSVMVTSTSGGGHTHAVTVICA
jgi:hypothetical protein